MFLIAVYLDGLAFALEWDGGGLPLVALVAVDEPRDVAVAAAVHVDVERAHLVSRTVARVHVVGQRELGVSRAEPVLVGKRQIKDRAVSRYHAVFVCVDEEIMTWNHTKKKKSYTFFFF